MAKIQRSADDLWTSLQTEMNQVTKPLEDMGKDIKTLGERIGHPPDSPVDAPDPESDADSEAETNPDPASDSDSEADTNPDPASDET